MMCDAHGLEAVSEEGCPICVEDEKRRAGLTRIHAPLIPLGLAGDGYLARRKKERKRDKRG